jgi:hypothetical protein
MPVIIGQFPPSLKLQATRLLEFLSILVTPFSALSHLGTETRSFRIKSFDSPVANPSLDLNLKLENTTSDLIESASADWKWQCNQSMNMIEIVQLLW